MVTPRRFERPTYRLGICRSILLSYGVLIMIIRAMRPCDQGLRLARGALIALVSIIFATVAAADNLLCDLPVVENAAVSTLIDGSTFELTDGREVRLASVLVPRGRETYASAGAEELTARIAGRTVGLALDEQAIDRHGRLLAQVFVDGVWVQRAMVAAGAARVRTLPGGRRCAGPLLEEEETARTAKRGLWALPEYRVRGVADLDADIGTFQIVEGTVVAVAASRGRVFLNFGADYRSDFTITIAPRDRKRLAKDGVVPESWSGKRIRARGWLSRLNGPELELTHPEQIQIVE